MNTPAFALMTLALALSLDARSRAQAGGAVLSVDDGSGVRPIARLVNGQWVNAAPCASGEASSIASGFRERLSVSQGLIARSVRAVGPGTPEWLRLAPTIAQVFDHRERAERLTPDRTGRSPRAIDWIYVLEAGSEHIYYFEASRRVAAASDDVDADTDPPGTIRVTVAGFLRDRREGPVPIGTKSELRWEQDGQPAGPGRPDLMPLGVVSYGDRSAWVMKGQSGSSRWFTLYEVGTQGARTVLTARVTPC